MEKKWHKIEQDGYTLIVNEGGKNIAFWKLTDMPSKI